MKNRFLLAIATLAIIILGCGGPKVLTTAKDNANKAAEQGDFNRAVELWQGYFNTNDIDKVSGESFAQAALAAFQTGNMKLATDWYDQARYKNFASDDMYFTLAKIHQSQKNISKEINALEFYNKNFTSKKAAVNARLFALYSEAGLNDKALKTWDVLEPASKNSIENLKVYFELNQKLENKEVCDSLANVILKTEPENTAALEWNAKKYYWRAENRYQSEMKKYNSHKTRKQYAILVKQLDMVTADFKRALPFFQKLWKQQPGEKYANYMANIYARFGDEKKSKTYQKYLK